MSDSILATNSSPAVTSQTPAHELRSGERSRDEAELTEPLPKLPIRRWNRVIGFLFYVWTLLATTIFTVFGVILAFASTPFDRNGNIVWGYTVGWSRLLLWTAGASVQRIDEASLPDGPCVFVCNHQSAFDILALFVSLERRFVFVAKKSLFRVPFLGWHIASAGYIPVDRSNREAAIRSLERGGELIRNGRSVAVFPEGTRSRDGSILPFKKGPFMLALKSGVPIVPVAIEGSLGVNPRKALYVCPNTIRVLVGKSFPTEGVTEDGRDELMRRVRSSMIRMHRRLGGLGGDESNAIAAAGVQGIGRAAEELAKEKASADSRAVLNSEAATNSEAVANSKAATHSEAAMNAKTATSSEPTLSTVSTSAETTVANGVEAGAITSNAGNELVEIDTPAAANSDNPDSKTSHDPKDLDTPVDSASTRKTAAQGEI